MIRKLPRLSQGLLLHVVCVQATLLAAVIFPTVGLILGITLNPGYAVISLLTFFATAAYFFRRFGFSPKVTVGYVAITILALAALNLKLDNFIDVSPDTHTAHGPAVSHFAHGWNPIYDPLFTRAPEVAGKDYPLLTVLLPTWVDYAAAAAKLPYFSRASIYSFTHYIDSTHFINVLVATLVPAFGFVTLTMLGYSTGFAVCASLVAGLSPLLMVQVTTYYIDQWMCAFLSLIALGALWLPMGMPRLVKIICAQAMLLVLATKLTGLVLAGFFFIAFNGLCLLKKKGFWLTRKEFAGLAIVGATLIFHPYGTNIVHFKNPFHPVSAGNKDLIAGTLGGFYRHAKRWQGLSTSLLAESQRGGEQPAKKAPWKIYRREQVAFQGPDARIAGFGPYFGLSLMLALAALLVSLGLRCEKNATALAVAATCFGLTLVWPITYWFRFSPQLWVVPLFVVLGAWKPGRARLPVRILGSLSLLACFVSTVFVGQASLRTQLELSRTFHAQLEFLKREPRVWQVAFSNFHLGRLRLYDEGIKYTPVKECRSGRIFALVFSENEICQVLTPTKPLQAPPLLTSSLPDRLPGG